LDVETIVNSVKKTGKVVIASDDVKYCSIASEIAMTVMENAFDYLDGPIVRVTSPPLPVPFSPELEKAYMVSDVKILNKIEEAFGYKLS
jgi:Pyruvate/2-oxoglutarate dehydrogenase complex, dehydrogenase (E1) component, eukaryotic type, beta subunit